MNYFVGKAIFAPQPMAPKICLQRMRELAEPKPMCAYQNSYTLVLAWQLMRAFGVFR
jgi:hypothetical protein